MFRLDRKIAPVTGAGSGIGRAIANPFANARACLCWSAIPGWEGNRGRIRAKGEMSTAIDCDVAAAESVGAAFRQIDREAPRIDILVNNAGITHIGTIENTSEKDLDSIHAVNVKGLFLCSRAAVPRMRKGGGGAIPNLTSIASLIGLVDRSAYSIGKRVVLAMTRSIAADFIGYKIRCNGVCPARVHTPFVDGPQGRLPGA